MPGCMSKVHTLLASGETRQERHGCLGNTSARDSRCYAHQRQTSNMRCGAKQCLIAMQLRIRIRIEEGQVLRTSSARPLSEATASQALHYVWRNLLHPWAQSVTPCC